MTDRLRLEKIEIYIEQIKKIRKDLEFDSTASIAKTLLKERIAEILNNQRNATKVLKRTPEAQDDEDEPHDAPITQPKPDSDNAKTQEKTKRYLDNFSKHIAIITH